MFLQERNCSYRLQSLLAGYMRVKSSTYWLQSICALQKPLCYNFLIYLDKIKNVIAKVAATKLLEGVNNNINNKNCHRNDLTCDYNTC